jgi:hypothetical protein
MPLGVKRRSVYRHAPMVRVWEMGKEFICLLSFPLLLRLATAFPGTVIGTQGFVDCVGEACLICDALAYARKLGDGSIQTHRAEIGNLSCFQV